MKFLKVKKERAQEFRRKILAAGVLDGSASVEREGEHVFFPVTSDPKIRGAALVEREGKRRQRRPRSMKDALKGILTCGEMESLQSSYNVVGDIAILEFDEELLPKSGQIGGAMLETFHNIKVVALKTEQVSGEYRVPGIKVLAGDNRTETIHKEHGCVYKLDVAEAYFSPRLGHERLRVVEQIRDGERVLVMFAGVGPYAVLAAKMRKCELTAVELNPKAVEYMRWNVLRNKVKVDVIEGDAKAVLPTLGKFDRIIMPLPKQADTFLKVTLPALKAGGMIHYYTFAHNSLEATGHLAETVATLGGRIRVEDAVECGSYSPCMARYCVDFTLQ
ncbi:MAG: class I SAM-dependent methyltransferase family protein [Candidatus Altiarchaeota archaeon]